jgi:glycosyltransferase involved in cell wall biosynthesis
MEMLVQRGHNVVLLTTCEKGDLHDIVSAFGVTAIGSNASGSKLSKFRANMKQLSQTIDQYKIETVIAQQQGPALIAGTLKKFKKFNLAYVRHNTDEAYQDHPVKAKWLNKLVNSVTPVKIAPSSVVEKFWIETEKVSPRQIRRINYGYNFNQYEKPEPTVVRSIKEQYPAGLRVLSMARLVPAKRHREMFNIIKDLHKKGLDIKLICLGTGPLEPELRQYVIDQQMSDFIFLTGRKTNIFDYIEASDIFMHLSTSEASNSAVKEVGINRKPVIVCKEVGDFEDYVVTGRNGYITEKINPVPETMAALEQAAADKEKLRALGERLASDVITMFDIQNVAPGYDALLKSFHA